MCRCADRGSSNAARIQDSGDVAVADASLRRCDLVCVLRPHMATAVHTHDVYGAMPAPIKAVAEYSGRRIKRLMPQKDLEAFFGDPAQGTRGATSRRKRLLESKQLQRPLNKQRAETGSHGEGYHVRISANQVFSTSCLQHFLAQLTTEESSMWRECSKTAFV
jgi:hypothetical protein